MNFSVNDWRLFLDSSCESFKVALLCNLGQRPSIPIVYGKISESHENVKKALNLIKYEDYNFPIIGDFKIINFLMGMQCGKTKFSAIFVFWIVEKRPIIT